jgi:hypothetical protein
MLHINQEKNKHAEMQFRVQLRLANRVRGQSEALLWFSSPQVPVHMSNGGIARKERECSGRVTKRRLAESERHCLITFPSATNLASSELTYPTGSLPDPAPPNNTISVPRLLLTSLILPDRFFHRSPRAAAAPLLRSRPSVALASTSALQSSTSIKVSFSSSLRTTLLRLHERVHIGGSSSISSVWLFGYEVCLQLSRGHL